MRTSIKSYVEKKLKENVPLGDIKKELKDKGCSADEIKRAVRESIAGVDKKYPLVQIGILVVVVIAIVGGIYLISNSGGEKSQANIQYSEICKNYATVANEVSCDEAIRLALEKYPGNATYVNKTQIKMRVGTPTNFTEVEERVWSVGIDLEKAMKFESGERKKIEIGVDVATKNVFMMKW